MTLKTSFSTITIRLFKLILSKQIGYSFQVAFKTAKFNIEQFFFLEKLSVLEDIRIMKKSPIIVRF